jgi:large subunit ribosomal protein L9
MKVILLKDVPKVGQINTVKEVKDGFALNMLIPRGLARFATPEAILNMERMKTQENKNKETHATALSEKISGLGQIEIKVKANEKGHLFAGVGKNEIAKKSGIPVENILLESSIKEIGEHEVEVSNGQKTQKIKLLLTQE